MPRQLGNAVLLLSASGYPLTQRAIRCHGAVGAAVVEAASVGLLVRDATMMAGGAVRRLRPLPAVLLPLETAAATAAAALGMRPLLVPAARDEVGDADPSLPERLRRAAVGILFALHTIRFWIYLRPGRGRRAR